MSCNLLVQCEPDYVYFAERPELQERQRALPIAHVHGVTDSVVAFSAAQYCRERLEDGGFKRSRLVEHDTAGHRFAFLPLEEAVRWLEEMTETDSDARVALARARLDQQRERDVVPLLEGLTGEAASALRTELEARAADGAQGLLPRLEAGDADGVDAFWAYRRRFGATRAAQPLLEGYAALRAEQEERAEELFSRARRTNDEAAKRALWEELVATCPASKWAPLVVRWLE